MSDSLIPLKVALYTCITKGYEAMLPKAPVFPSIQDKIMFCDFNIPDSLGWTAKKLESPKAITRPDMINRYHKLFAHKILKNYDISIYIDGNILLYDNPESLIKKFLLSGCPIGLSRHPRRESIAEELLACIELGKFKMGDEKNAYDQVSKYLVNEKFPDNKLFYGGVIFRNHQYKEDLDTSMVLWWRELQNQTARDQISLPYVIWKSGLPVHEVSINISDNPYFYRFSHLNGLKPWKFLPRVIKYKIIGALNLFSN